MRRSDAPDRASALKVSIKGKDWGSVLKELSYLQRLRARSEEAQQKLGAATSSQAGVAREWRKMRIKLDDGSSSEGASDGANHLRHSDPEPDDDVEPDLMTSHLRHADPDEEGHHLQSTTSLSGAVDSAAGKVAESLASAIAAQVSHDMQQELQERVHSALGRVRVALNGNQGPAPPVADPWEADWSASVSEALAKVTQRYGFLGEEVSFSRAAALLAYVLFSSF
jgi:hypothetical protein